MKWKILSQKNCYSGFLTINEYELEHELFQGGGTPAIRRELVELGHAVAVLLYDPVLDNIVLIEQFRIGALNDNNSSWLLELVAGMVDDGEQFEDCLVRETREEAGLEIIRSEKIMHYYSTPGTCSEQITLYYGEVDSSSAGGVYGLDHEHEDIRVHVVSYSDVMTMLDNGRINSATPVIGLQWLRLNRERLRKR